MLILLSLFLCLLFCVRNDAEITGLPLRYESIILSEAKEAARYANSR